VAGAVGAAAGAAEVASGALSGASALASTLMTHGLLPAERVVAGDCEINDASRRQQNWIVRMASGPAYLVKQDGEAERAAALAHEAAMYAYLTSGPGAAARLRLPTVVAWDPDASLLVLELLRDAVPFGSTARRTRARGPAGALGTALGRMHRTSPGAGLPATPLPPILRLAWPDPTILADLSPASIQLVQLLQQRRGFTAGFAALAAVWQPAALIHFDLKWDNILLIRDRHGRRSRIALVHWELAGAGDPCWDVGAVCGGYLQAWLASVPHQPGQSVEAVLAAAGPPLAMLQPALRAFWQAYLAALMPTDPARRLLRVAGYAAVRLIQTSLEAAQTAVELPAAAILPLQVALNMIQHPHEAAVHLLGLPWPEV
jgi:hypothetical protein